MQKLFQRIGQRIEKSPIKVLLISIIVFAILITGVVSVRMATGNETLLMTDNEVYKSNYAMEDSFGGDSIIVLFEGDEEKLLEQNNLQKMWNVEQRLKYEDNIFGIMSPASIVHQITDRQSVEIKKQILTISEGLNEMSGKLIEIGTELNKKDVKDPKEIEEKLNNLSNITSVFSKLIEGQNNLSEGATQLSGGLTNIADGLKGVSAQLQALGNELSANPKINIKLNMIAENIYKSSEGLATMAEKTSKIKMGSENTSTALSNISTQLSKETQSMKEGVTGGLNPDDLKMMADGFITMGENLGKLSEGLETFHRKSEMMIPYFPANQEELDNILYDDGTLRSMFSDVIVDGNHSIMMIKLQGNLEDKYKDEIYSKVSIALEKEDFDDISYIISGKPVLDSSLRAEMKTNMKYMVVSAVVLMFIILMFVFNVRWRVLSLGVIFVSVIATLGFMGHMGVPMTMVSMAVFPILIGLGIDYSIQFQNRYEEEKSAKTTLTQIGTAVGIAVLATVLGFISLYASPVPMIKDFGKMLTIGVIISFIGSIFLLMPVLTSRDLFDEKSKKKLKVASDKPTLLDRLLEFNTKVVTKFSIFIIVLAMVISYFGIVADQKVGVETDIETFMPQDMEALDNIHYLRDIIGSTNQLAIFIEGDIITEANLSWMKDTVELIEKKYGDKIVDIKSIDNLVYKMTDSNELSIDEYKDIINDLPKAQSKMFLNEKMDKSVILMNIKHMSTEELKDFVNGLNKDLKNSPVKVSITGKSVLDVEMVKGLTTGRVKMTLIGLALVFVALLLIYRNIVKAFIPVFPIILIVGMSGGIMYLLDLKYTPITATLGALVLGMGTEMTIMLLERYLEERNSGKEKLDAMLITVKMIGKATVASGLTTVGGFSVLMFSKFVILKDFGLMTVINISLALMSTFVILPAVIMLFDGLIVDKKVKKIATNKLADLK